VGLSGPGLPPPVTGTPHGMERGSTKHGPRLDDQMAQEARGHLQGGPAGGRAGEWHEPEPAGEDQPEPALVPLGERRRRRRRESHE
jgi:hypothetical protein